MSQAFHGASRASLRRRLLGGSAREPVKFNDGLVDIFRIRGALSFVKNPGLRLQTDKKQDLKLNFGGPEGTGIFFQYDGEARYAFSPEGKDFNIFIRRVLRVPVVLGPQHCARLTGGAESVPAGFEICGETKQEREEVRRRIFRLFNGELVQELCASRQELERANLAQPKPAKSQVPSSEA